jgi:hypothetical protein
MNWTCRYCGKDTKWIDVDYLVDTDHLQCVLEYENKKPKVMKIKGWEKISGFTYKGFTMVNPMHNAEETRYEATILNLNLPQKPKWELVVLTPAHRFKQDNIFSITIWDENKLHTSNTMTKQMMKSISNFRQIFEEMVDEILKIQLISAPTYSSHSISGGIVNHVNNSGTTVPYGQMIQSIQSIQQTINNLTQNTPSNPF